MEIKPWRAKSRQSWVPHEFRNPILRRFCILRQFNKCITQRLIVTDPGSICPLSPCFSYFFAGSQCSSIMYSCDSKFDVTSAHQYNVLITVYIIFAAMAGPSSSFLKINDDENLCCLLCRHSLKENDTVNSFTERGWQTLLSNAAKWKDINIPVNHEFYMFTAAYDLLMRQSTPNGEGHERCRITISTKAKQFLNRFGNKTDEKIKNIVDNDEKPKTVKKDTRQSNPLALGVCFVCGERRPCDPYYAGGLGSMSKIKT